MSKVDIMPEGLTTTVTIADGASLSGAGDLKGYALGGIILPSGWDTAAITFQVSYDGTTYGNFYWEGTEVSFAGQVASAIVGVAADKFFGWNFVKVRSGTAASAVNQSGAVTLTLMLRAL